MIKIEVVTVGPFAMNAMVVYDSVSFRGFLVDPGDEVARILERVKELKLAIEAIVFTHGHIDHVAYAEEARQALAVPTFLHEDDWKLVQMLPQQAMMFGLAPCPVVKIDRSLPGEGEFSVAGINFQARHTPGHSPGSVTLINLEEKLAIVGDLIFAGSVGRTDLPGCSPAALDDSLARVILPLPDDVVLYPGHGHSTTVGVERRSNPFLRTAAG